MICCCSKPWKTAPHTHKLVLLGEFRCSCIFSVPPPIWETLFLPLFPILAAVIFGACVHQACLRAAWLFGVLFPLASQRALLNKTKHSSFKSLLIPYISGMSFLHFLSHRALLLFLHHQVLVLFFFFLILVSFPALLFSIFAYARCCCYCLYSSLLDELRESSSEDVWLGLRRHMVRNPLRAPQQQTFDPPCCPGQPWGHGLQHDSCSALQCPVP